ncbi:MAG: hypothetical protein EOO02_03245 [Chitinophagaceae bacterium]|nr:MAG: hypothetical protein EOO02_03245 [Chitinophagaceae bacterium]
MQRNFYNDDFEELLREKADQYKMYPSDKVWNGIQNSLHSKRKWYWLGFALLLSGVSYYAIDALIAPPQKHASQNKTIAAAGLSAASNTTTESTEAPEASINPSLVIPIPQQKNNSKQNSGIDQPFYGVFNIDRSLASVEPGATVKMVESTLGTQEDHKDQNGNRRSKLAPVRLMTGYFEEIQLDNPLETANTTAAGTNGSEAGKSLRFPLEEAPAAEDVMKINWLQQNALFEMDLPKLKRTSLQLALTPTMNYRKLSANRNPGGEYLVKNIPVAMNGNEDINAVVNHKPAIGFELGAHVRYAADRTVTLKAGLQFNFARYTIEAFASPSTDLAAIALNSASIGVRRDSMISYSRISNVGGNSEQEIQNQYFQISAPIGIELLVAGGRRLRMHIAGTVQPTYLLNRNSYLITTDYLNYTKEPSLVRRWNVNTAAEAFLSYNTGTISWQVGPQFRYQLLSTYSSRYPIRENLMEYGVKIGVTKTIR